MNIRQEISNIKTLFGQGAELLLLRLRLLRLDMEEQLVGVVKIFACIAFTAVFALIFLVALLLGLNVVLPENIKIWVFFGVAALALLIMLVLVYCIPVIWQKNRNQLSHTLHEMQQDIVRLRGKHAEHFDSSHFSGE